MDKEKRVSKILVPMNNKEFTRWYKHESKRNPKETMKGSREMFLSAIWNAWKLGYAFGKGIDDETIGKMS